MSRQIKDRLLFVEIARKYILEGKDRQKAYRTKPHRRFKAAGGGFGVSRAAVSRIWIVKINFLQFFYHYAKKSI